LQALKKFIILALVSLLFTSCQIQNVDETTTIKEFIEQTRKPKENFFAVIPHHSLVSDEIDEFYKYLSETYSGSKIDNVVIISSNHFNYN
jgi:predicted class III extradiol MEMO1 family dioxygenase